MASEDRTEYFGIPFIRSQAFQIFTSTAAAVIHQDGGEWSAATRPPQHRAQGSRPTLNDNRFWLARRLAPGRLDGERQKERH